MALSVTTDKRGRRTLKSLDDFLKPASRSAKRVEGDGSDVFADYLDQRIDRQERRAKRKEQTSGSE